MAVDGEGTATDETDEGPYTEGTVVSIKAEAEEGWKFVNWTAPEGTFADDEAAETTFTMPGEAVTVTANFVELGIDGDTVTLDGDETYVDDTAGTVWVISIADFITDGALNPGGPDDTEDFQLTVTFDTLFSPDSVTFTVVAEDIDFCTTWADLFAALDGESEATGYRGGTMLGANDQATLNWDGSNLTVTSERISSGMTTPSGDRDIESVTFSN